MLFLSLGFLPYSEGAGCHVIRHPVERQRGKEPSPASHHMGELGRVSLPFKPLGGCSLNYNLITALCATLYRTT